MTRAHSLSSIDDDLEVFPGDDISMFSPEGQAIIREAEARLQSGGAVLTPHAEIEAMLERQRLAATKAG